MSVVCLGNCDKRILVDEKNKEYVIHSLESFNYLKIDPGNFISFEQRESDILINVMQEYVKTGEDEAFTTFSKVYSIKVDQVTLRQLLLFQSLFLCTTASNIVDLVND